MILTVLLPMVITRLTPVPSKPGTILAVTGSPTAPFSASELAVTEPLATSFVTDVNVNASVPAGASADEQSGQRLTSAYSQLPVPVASITSVSWCLFHFPTNGVRSGCVDVVCVTLDDDAAVDVDVDVEV
jgi:hypothetical protein